MFLYDLSHRFTLFDFGIKIPIMDDKVVRTIQSLREHPTLGRDFDRLSVKQVDALLDREDLLRVHSLEYVDRLFSEKLEEEVILSYELVDGQGNYHRYNPCDAVRPFADLFQNELQRAAGTYQCTRLALKEGFCFYFGGGSHHAKRDHGAGFCILNDIVIALRKLQAEKRINSAWVIDLDAHKGDGTAALTADDPSIKTLSIHMAAGWPLDGEPVIEGIPNPSFIPSDIDIPVAVGEDAIYNEKLKTGLNELASLSSPDIAIVVAGADPYEKDGLPSSSGLKLTLEQMKERDLLVYQFLRTLNIPQAYVMAGGYGSACWEVYTAFLEWITGQIR